MSARINLELELKILDEINKGELSYTQIGKKYNVSKTTVTNVRMRKGEKQKNRKLTFKERETIINDIKTNKLRRIEVARKYGITYYSAGYYVSKANETIVNGFRKYVEDTDSIGTIIKDINTNTMTNKQLMDKHGVSLHRVIEIKKRYTDKVKVTDVKRTKRIYELIDKGYSNVYIGDAVGASRALVSYYRRKITI